MHRCLVYSSMNPHQHVHVWYFISNRSQSLFNLYYLRQLVWYCPANYHQYTTTYQKHISHILVAALVHCVHTPCRGPRLPSSSLEQDDSAAIPPAWTLSLLSLPTWTKVHQATHLAPSSQLHLAKLRVDEVLSALNLDKQIIKIYKTIWGLQQQYTC